MPSTFKAIDALPSATSSTAAAALASLSTTYRYNNTILLPSLEERLQTPLSSSAAAAITTFSISPTADDTSEINSSTGLTSISHVASVVVSNFLPLSSTSLSSSDDDTTSADDTNISSTSTSSTATAAASSSLPLSSTTFYPSYSPPVVESLVASSAEEFSNNFRDLSFDIFDDNDNDLFGSPLAFDASENGLWNGRFVPPPPRPPFFVDEPVLSDGLTTCDLCSWAMPTKSTFIFEGTMEKASELGWPLTLTIVSILSAILGAIIMIAVVKCRRKKTSHQRSDTHVQWWSRNKRPNGNNNHLRRSNIYTAHPADSIRGLQQPNSLSASSSMTAMTTAMTVAPTANSTTTTQMPYYHPQQIQQHSHTLPVQHVLGNQQHQQQYLQQFEHEHEYHQPQELQLQLQPQQQLQPSSHFNHPHNHHHHQQQQQQHNNNILHHHHQHTQQHPGASVVVGGMLQHGPQHQHSASMSSSSTNSMPSLSTQPLQMQIPEQIHLQKSSNQPQHVHMQHNKQNNKQQHNHHLQQQQHPHLHHQQQHEQDLELEQSSSDLHDNMFHWPTATSIVTS
ncbi:lateral signaling target protein 2 homolog [Lucilia sericata]|uniref:lateral signaling target protein 2 homolog n=1 Tax=Lucilia sericata TaxID=13632 RepID=UPI0018A836DF|nr:lateral signaling target protein 2 homolog [Lucilia sericata]